MAGVCSPDPIGEHVEDSLDVSDSVPGLEAHDGHSSWAAEVSDENEDTEDRGRYAALSHHPPKAPAHVVVPHVMHVCGIGAGC